MALTGVVEAIPFADGYVLLRTDTGAVSYCRDSSWQKQPAGFFSNASETGERPPPKGGGFGLRLKAGSVRHSADYVTWKSSSGSGGFWFLMYSAQASSVTLPLETTQ